MRNRKTLLRCLFCVTSGVLFSVAYTFTSLWALSFFALVPFLCVVLGCNYGYFSLIKYVFLFSLGYYSILLLWMLNISVFLPFSESVSKVVLLFCTFLVGLLQGVYLCLAVFVFVKLRRNNFLDTIIFSLLFVLSEWFAENTPFLAFPWGKAAAVVTPFTPFIQSASLFGGIFLSFLVVFINAGLAYALLNVRSTRKALSSLGAVIIVFVINTAYGYARIYTKKEQNQFKAMVVQGNYSGLNKWKATSSDIFKTYVKLTREGVDKDTRLVIWPETAVPTILTSDSTYAKELQELSKELNTTIVAGFFMKNQEGSKHYNALVAFCPDGTMSNAYYKQILAPFGEYFPFGENLKKLVPMLGELIDNSSGLLFGEKTEVIYTPAGRIGGIICYESIFTKMSLETADEGAQIIAVASNDSWFGESSALYQHYSHSILRAVETGKYVLRASNTGISAIISPNGQAISVAQPFKQTYAKSFVYLNNEKTFFCKTGQLFILPCLAVYIIGLVRTVFFRRFGKQSKI